MVDRFIKKQYILVHYLILLKKTVAHGVSDLDFVTLIYGTSYNTSGRSFPLPATIVTISSGLASASIYVVADRNNKSL